MAEPVPTWVDILDSLEASISLAFAGEDSDWQPPAADPGPIPEELLDRALRLLDARREAERMLTEKRTTVARHLSAVNAVPDAPQRRILDISA